METKEKPTMYYIRGVRDRGNEVLRMLEEKGGNVRDICISGAHDDLIYIIMPNGVIAYLSEDDRLFEIISFYGTELHLPENPKVLKWEDVKEPDGYFLRSDSIRKIDCPTYGDNGRDLFITEQQAKSVQAAAMISQIREQGKESYGDIMRIGVCSFVITRTNIKDFKIIILKLYSHGGLLRFETREQAELFLENNRELVEEYLKTF